jgi:hypothetical protein
MTVAEAFQVMSANGRQFPLFLIIMQSEIFFVAINRVRVNFVAASRGFRKTGFRVQ